MSALPFLNDVEVFSTVLPGKVLDYMTCQTPIVAGVKGIAADLIRENQTGYAFSSNDTTLMLEKVLELKEDQELLARMQANCLTTVTKHFLWEHNIERLVDIIE